MNRSWAVYGLLSIVVFAVLSDVDCEEARSLVLPGKQKIKRWRTVSFKLCAYLEKAVLVLRSEKMEVTRRQPNAFGSWWRCCGFAEDNPAEHTGGGHAAQQLVISLLGAWGQKMQLYFMVVTLYTLNREKSHSFGVRRVKQGLSSALCRIRRTQGDA